MRKNQKISFENIQLEIPGKYRTFWTDTYLLQIETRFHALYCDQNDNQIRPRDTRLQLTAEQISQAKNLVRLYSLKIKGFDVLISVGQDEREIEELADFILSSTKRPVKLDFVEVNGLRGSYYDGFSEGIKSREWWFKKGSTLLSVALKGPDIPSKEVTADIDWILNSIQ